MWSGFCSTLLTASEESKSKKVWICLFSCCVTRGVHLELVTDISTQTFLRSFKHFTARRGTPTQVISDNAKTFSTAAQYLLKLTVKWSFNLEKAPWWGGFFEQMVQSVKQCLRKSIRSAMLSYDELSTVLTKSRSHYKFKTNLYLSSEDLEEPLTPSHLLMIGHHVLSLPDSTRATV